MPSVDRATEEELVVQKDLHPPLGNAPPLPTTSPKVKGGHGGPPYEILTTVVQFYFPATAVLN